LAATLSIKGVFTIRVYVHCAQVVNSFYLFLEVVVCLHKHHDLYSHHLDLGLYDGDHDLVRELVYVEHGVVGGDTGPSPDGVDDLLFFVFCQDSS
jgi:hypothetical protein